MLAAGTGLGQSILVWDGARYRVVPSEGGHSDFAPHTEQQIELLRFMRRRYPQVSWELILSGRGFRTLHEFLAPNVTITPSRTPTPIPLRKSPGSDFPKNVRSAPTLSIYGPRSMAPKQGISL